MAQASDILLFLALLALGWILFIFWLVGLAFRGIWRGLTMLSGKSTTVGAGPAKTRRCTRLRCRAVNPAEANYCRRCGGSLAASGGRPGAAVKSRQPRWVS